MPRPPVFGFGVVASGVLMGCAGGDFHVDGPLRSTPELKVSGTLGLNHAFCHAESASGGPGHPPKLQGLGANQDASVTIGDWSGTVSAPQRNVMSEASFRDSVLRDYARFSRKSHGRKAGGAALQSAGAGAQAGGGSPAGSPPGNVAAAAGATTASPAVATAPREAVPDDPIDPSLLALPRRPNETMAFTLVATREGRTITAACASTETARFLGVYDGPHFSLSCRIVSSADGVPRDLRVAARGNWADYAYTGGLRTLPPPATAGGAVPSTDRATFTSQNTNLGGMATIRGFELRSSTGQLAAISFWQETTDRGAAEARAWELERPSPGWSDALATTLAISYAVPWPTACDDQLLREQAGKARADAH